MTWTGTMADWLRDGPRLVREGVTRVVVTDRKPDASNGGFCFWPPWANRPLAQVIAESDLRRGLGFYPTEAAALDAISAACLAWAKEQQP